MTEYTVHFQKGSRVGARSIRMETVTADSREAAVAAAKHIFHDYRRQGYRVVRVDYFCDGRLLEA